MTDDDLTIRDYFAAKALQGMIANEGWFSRKPGWKSTIEMTDQFAEEAYAFADAMLLERNEPRRSDKE